MALRCGGAVEKLRFDIVASHAEAAPQTNAEIVLRIHIAPRGSATEEIDRFCMVGWRG
jgi:hypothetical protein